jgi:hypothetical protein
MATHHPSPRHLTQKFLAVTVEKDAANGQHYVHVRKNAGEVAYGQHPTFTPNEAEALGRDVNNAAAEARRANVRDKL